MTDLSQIQIFQRIKEQAKSKGMNLAEVNEASGMKTNVIYSWKTKKPSAESLSKVADVLDVSVDYLLGNTDEKNPHLTKDEDSNADLKEYFEKHPALKFDGKDIPEAEMRIIRRILEDMDD